ncbi:MAG: hypothetical protein ACK55Z_34630 [bacterium]
MYAYVCTTSQSYQSILVYAHAFMRTPKTHANDDFFFKSLTGDAGNTRDARGGVPSW